MKDLKHIKRFNKSDENLNISDVSNRKIIHSNEKYTLDKNEMLFFFGMYINEMDDKKLVELWKNLDIDKWMIDKYYKK